MTSPATEEELRDLDRKFYEMLSALPRVAEEKQVERRKAA